MKQAGWTDSELRAFMIKHFHKSHWNLLAIPERRAVIAMLQNYIHKAGYPAANNENQSSNEHTSTTINKPHKENTNGTDSQAQD
jgi:hypothetical protein